MTQPESTEEPMELEVVVEGLTHTHRPGELAKFNPFNLTLEVKIEHPKSLICASALKSREHWLRNTHTALSFSEDESKWFVEFTGMIRERIQSMARSGANLACFSFVGGPLHGAVYSSAAFQHHPEVTKYLRDVAMNVPRTLH